jgi:hypothetical protein
MLLMLMWQRGQVLWMVVVWMGIVNEGGGEQRVEVVYDAQIECWQMPKLNLGICGNDVLLLGYMVHA